MDPDFIARLIELVERSTVAELDLTVGDARLRLVKSHGLPPGGSGPAASGSEAVRPRSDRASAPPASSSPPMPAAKRVHTVRAGFPGTFYRAPAPGEKPFVEEGTAVEDGTQLAILEAMKTMNPVEADIAGTVLRVLPADGTPVEAGDPLADIEPAV